MLKRLELIGFKSFADKTVFDFAAGITAVVGPNGSGKSNVVDAVKWVLGEQSAKSLRGGEMTDVIFNGSTSRKSLGLAEVSLVFDNVKGQLGTESTEVRITRRVYRDGQGEYLINGQIGRLKDIKDLFLGTGAGAGAYSIIEQGRVDALLQSNVEDRRAIFEEAAGVSRFKVKKGECLRRLERVGQNLARVQDILTGVDGRLKTVRLQAAKAQRYQEYATRLKLLRVGLGLREYGTLATQANAAEAALASLQAVLAQSATLSADWSDEAKEIDANLIAVEALLRAREQVLANTRGRLVALTGTIDHDRVLAGELDVEVNRGRTRLAELTATLQTLAAAVIRANDETATAEQLVHDEDVKVVDIAASMKVLTAAIAAERTAIETDQAEHLERLRDAARWQNETVSARALLDQLRRERDRLSAKSVQATEHLATLDHELAGLTSAEGELHERLLNSKRVLSERVADRDCAQNDVQRLQRQLSDQRANSSGLASRIEVLEGIERSHEGLGAGIREVLALLANGEPGLSEAVIGLVTDGLTAPREVAPLIDLALGKMAECFLVRDVERLHEYLAERTPTFVGRVGFLPLAGDTATLINAMIPSRHDVSRRADSLVTCDQPGLLDLPTRLLGTTYLVANLEVARELALALPDCRFVTANGELLESDGTLTVGTHHAETGVLSRKSELRDLRSQADAVAENIAKVVAEIADRNETAESLGSGIGRLRQEIEVLIEQETDLRTRVVRHRERRHGLHEEVTLSRTELSGLTAEIARTEASMSSYSSKSHAAENAAATAQRNIEERDQAIHRHEALRVAAEDEHTAARIGLARLRERVDGLRSQQTAATRAVEERRIEADEWTARVVDVEGRLRRCLLSLLAAAAEVAAATATREATEAEIGGIVADVDELKREQRRLGEQLRTAHDEWQQRRDEAHAKQLEANDLRHRIEGLSSRLAEDYQIDLAALFAVTTTATELDGTTDEDARGEIDELRQKLSRLGNVNLDALEELAQIELKTQALQTQFDDLTHARKALEEIIQKINADSRTLFAETFAAIRVQFQDLFRRLFGGGMADIVLENPEDVLESGIEIVARPPGKELRSISLMSGGERTMTAVALLLAIFRSKPSPFCLLDEVDAALDEANTARLTTVLREFASTSQFIVITHAKRTMAAADVLYGVTMQESGISKRIAVRFEDWPDERQAA